MLSVFGQLSGQCSTVKCLSKLYVLCCELACLLIVYHHAMTYCRCLGGDYPEKKSAPDPHPSLSVYKDPVSTPQPS